MNNFYTIYRLNLKRFFGICFGLHSLGNDFIDEYINKLGRRKTMDIQTQSFANEVNDYISKYREAYNQEEELEKLVNEELIDFKKELKLIMEQRLQRIVQIKEQNGHKLQHPYAEPLRHHEHKTIVPNEKITRYLDDLKHYNTKDILTPVKQMTYRSSRARSIPVKAKDSPQEEDIHIMNSFLQPSTPLAILLSPVEITHNIDIKSLEDSSPPSDNESSPEESDFDDEIYTYYYESDISVDSNAESNRKSQRNWNITNL
ncbi:hypothetical protein, no similarity [Maudiozyma barnettii]|uniref:Uncharacterized protein n=1 Tax=Maudiozyma barnettii TaxID=61262 RepID=A0A8H2VII9_9SACH|nr:hypothetical protein, no similarity [Kazachstania barnettii]CAB4256030.1 hypothetical protein, no similarity [Kazachstania barnettii]CAD1784638.1 hypothetical protein, no similarity [Kazachstania barnettii]